MADVAEATTSPVESQSITYRGTTRNLEPGMALLIAAIMAFVMGMADVFFAEALAWTFAIWGILLIYIGLLDIYETFEVTDEALVIKNILRPWGGTKIWPWERINRLDIEIKRPDAEPRDIQLKVFYTEEGELASEREDRRYEPELARLIIERAGLNPADAGNPQDLDNLPSGHKAIFTWS
jgi:hypothetical protein